MAAVDFNAIASAIATRFAAAAITPPTGADDVRVATHELPQQIGATPTVLVFPAQVDMQFGPTLRKGVAVYPVRWYIYKVQDQPRNAVLILKWLNSLYAQTEGQVHLGLSSYVTHADVTALRAGALDYAGETFEGIETTVNVYFWEALSPVA